MNEHKFSKVSMAALELDTTPDGSRENLSESASSGRGFFKHFPVLGIGMLFAVLVCTSASILVLVLSDGQSKNVWPSLVAPNVLINIINSVANICFAIAIADGVAISWWRMAIKGAPVEDLHRSLAINTFIKEVLRSPKTIQSFNIIALAAITAKLAIIDSTLLQRAATTQLDMDLPQKINVSAAFYTDFPVTGRTAGAGDTQYGLMTPDLNYALKIWAAQPKSLPNYFYGCQGACFPTIETIGFEIECSPEISTPIDYAAQVHHYSIDNASNADSDISSPILFKLDFNTTSDEDGNAYLEMKSIFTSSNDSTIQADSCPGSQTIQTCSLWPALVTYPVMIQNFSTDLGSVPNMMVGPDIKWWLDPNPNVTSYTPVYDPPTKQIRGYTIGRRLNWTENVNFTSSANTRLAGIQQAFMTYLSGSTDMYYYDGLGYQLETEGNAPYYLMNEPGIAECGFQYDNPVIPTGASGVETVIQKINEIMVTYAMFGAYQVLPNTTFPNVDATTVSVHYESNYLFMAGAIISTIICIILVLPSYWGFWQLGRKVTLDSIEIAHAFRSPMTAHIHDPTEEGLVKGMASEMHGQDVRYGKIATADGYIFGLGPKDEVQPIYPARRMGSRGT